MFGRFALALLLLTARPPDRLTAQDSLPRDARWRADLRFLADSLAARHVDAFKYVTRDSFAGAVAALDRDVPRLTDTQIQLRLARIGALIRDGHTNVQQPAYTVRWPVSTLLTDSGAHIVASTEAYDSLLGRKVVAVNGHPIAVVMDSLRQYLSHENEYGWRTRAGFMLLRPQALRDAGLGTDTAATELTLEGPAGPSRAMLTSVPVQNSGVRRPPSAPVPLWRQQANLRYWFRYLAESRTLYIAYNQCNNFEAFRAMTDSVVALLDSTPVVKVVVDLRNNSGGNSRVIAPLLSALEARTRSRPVALFAVIGRATFSSGMQAALDLKRRGATLVGEPIGERPNTFGEVRSFRLPHSSVEVTYSTRFFRNLPGEDPDAVYPDVSIPPTAQEQIAGRDGVMEWITRR